MKLELVKEKKRPISVALLAVSACLAVLILVKVVSFFEASARAEEIAKKAIEMSEPDDERVEKQLEKSRETADELKKVNLFLPPQAQKEPSVREVNGILGETVLIGDKWYKAGDMVGDAKIVAVEATQVRVEIDGRVRVFAPINATAGAESGPSRSTRGPRREQVAEADSVTSTTAQQPVSVQVQVGGATEGGFRGFSRGDMEGMRERWQNMSDDERRALRDRMREQFGGMRGRGGGRGDFGGGRGGFGGRGGGGGRGGF